MDDISATSTSSLRLHSNLAEDSMSSSSSLVSSSLLSSDEACSWSVRSADLRDGEDRRSEPKDSTCEERESAVTSRIPISGSELGGSSMAAVGGGRKRPRSISCAKELILADIRRRQKLALLYFELGSLLPGFNKIDQVALVEEAINYIKQLEERIKVLEEKSEEKSAESDGSFSCSGDNKDQVCSADNPGLDITARVLGKDILIRIFAKRNYDIVPKIYGEISKLKLKHSSSNAMTLGNCGLHMTVVAQMGDESCMTSTDVVNHLRKVLASA